MTPATVTEADREAAHALFMAHFHDGRWDGVVKNAVAQALANARAEESRACEKMLRDGGFYWAADAIAKRRGGE